MEARLGTRRKERANYQDKSTWFKYFLHEKQFCTGIYSTSLWIKVKQVFGIDCKTTNKFVHIFATFSFKYFISNLRL